MVGHNGFIVSVFLVFILSLSGIAFAQRVIDLDKVWGDIRVLGAAADDDSGYRVAYGDINGDGFMDTIISAHRAAPHGRINAGETYVIFGSSSPPSTTDLNSQSADITVSTTNLSIGSHIIYFKVQDNGGEWSDEVSQSLTISPTLSPQERAYLYLYEMMDKFHTSFDVYTDQDAGGNHFYPSGWMGDLSAISFDSEYIYNPHSGATCIKITFTANGDNWSGIYWQEPENNWGDIPNAGYDLTGATKLTFWARGEKGGERIEFFCGGITGIYPDSLPKTSLGYIILTKEWKEYTIDLSGKDLSYIIGGFGWVTNASKNPTGATFYLDDIRYDKQRLNDLRFLVSYETLSVVNPDRYIRNTCFIYDNALAMIAFMARGTEEDWRRAKILADSFVFAQEKDRFYTDGRLRNAYISGDLADRQTGKARLPRWWDPDAEKWDEDEFQVSSYTGNMAWVIIALTQYYKARGEEEYKSAAVSLGDWIYKHTHDDRGAGGYTGGYKGWEPSPTKIMWKSTEHNIDVYVAFKRLYEITGESVWLDRAIHAKNFVGAMWNESNGHFWTGTLDDGVTINQQNIPLDIQAWGLMALGSKYGSGVSWAENNCLVDPCPKGCGFKGFDFDNDIDGVWFEGTSQMCIAFQIKGETGKSEEFINELRKAQVSATNNNGKGIVAACHDGVTTGFNWEYFNRLHIGASAWFIFAERGYNPFKPSGGPLVTAHGLGGKGWIKEFNIFGNPIRSFKAFGAANAQGEVHLAVADTDADGRDEIAAGQGEGAKSWVKFFEVDGSLISSLKAFGASNTNGEVHLTIGNFDDFTSDKEIAVAQGEGGQSWVKVFEADGTLILSFKAFGGANAKGEVHLATGDLNKDGIDEIIVGMGEGGSSWVKVFNLWGDFIRSFRAFDAIVNPGGEVRLAVGNFDADPAVEIAVATGYNGGNKVRLFDKFGNFIREFTAFGFGGNPNGDVQIAAADIVNDGIDEVICGHGEGGSSVVKVFKADGTVILSFKAFGAVNTKGEVHLGKSKY